MAMLAEVRYTSKHILEYLFMKLKITFSQKQDYSRWPYIGLRSRKLEHL